MSGSVLEERLGAYSVAPGGNLQRYPLSYGEELRPLLAGQQPITLERGPRA